jgi:uncharacterized protein (TIGR04222 family)
MNPFDLRGPEFLLLYAVLALGTLLLGIAARRLVVPAVDPPVRLPELGPFALAQLVGGDAGAIRAALAWLHRNALIDANAAGLRTIAVLPEGAHPLPAALHRFLARGATDPADGPWYRITFGQLRTTARSALARLDQELVDLDLLADSGTTGRVRFARIVLLLGLLTIGAIKVAVGVARERPVVFLVLAMALCLVVGIVLIGRGWRVRTPLGDRTVQAEIERNGALRLTAQSAPNRLTGDDAAMAVGLFGAALLVDDLAAIRPYAEPPRQNSGSCGGSSCGGGGGGGGCGGCGG